MTDESRRLNDEIVKVKRQEADLRGVVGEKDKMIQVRPHMAVLEVNADLIYSADPPR